MSSDIDFPVDALNIEWICFLVKNNFSVYYHLPWKTDLFLWTQEGPVLSAEP